jgi:hypothetical protein
VECQTEAVSPGSRRSSSSPPPGRGWVLSRRDPGSADFVPARTQSQTGQPVSALEAGVRDRKPKASSPSCLRATSDEAPVRAD